jgi:DNA-directed RNA polymerase alpha subunit
MNAEKFFAENISVDSTGRKIQNLMCWNGINTIADLVALTTRDVRRWRGCGQKSLGRIELCLAKHGLALKA